ncbi:uncharacterized protein BJ171DRAFT_615129, partial [Polychytrium aggregatum]|uniref:uncharacterized protein n=1 Tax=Polychytrium aggregatum TaxID=110093 RepID=UPI0022FF3D8C
RRADPGALAVAAEPARALVHGHQPGVVQIAAAEIAVSVAALAGGEDALAAGRCAASPECECASMRCLCARTDCGHGIPTRTRVGTEPPQSDRTATGHSGCVLFVGHLSSQQFRPLLHLALPCCCWTLVHRLRIDRATQNVRARLARAATAPPTRNLGLSLSQKKDEACVAARPLLASPRLSSPLLASPFAPRYPLSLCPRCVAGPAPLARRLSPPLAASRRSALALAVGPQKPRGSLPVSVSASARTTESSVLLSSAARCCPTSAFACRHPVASVDISAGAFLAAPS